MPPKKTESAKKRTLAAKNKRHRSRLVNIGDQTDRWRTLKGTLSAISDRDLAKLLIDSYLEQQTSSVFHQMTAQNIVGKISTPKGTISGLLKGISDVSSITSESDQEIPKGLQQKRRVDVTPGPSGIKRIRKDIEKTPTIHLVGKTEDDTLKEKKMKYSVDFDLSSTDMEDILDPDFDPDDPTYEPEGWKNISIVQSELDSCEDEQGLEESVFEIGVDTEEEIPDETFPSKGTQRLTDIEEHIITEDKCIVTHQMLKELIAMYPKRQCGICQVDMITEIKKVGCVAECVWRCCNGHVFRWATSSMMPNGVYLTNFQAMSAIILSGNNYFKVALFAKFLSLSFPGPTTFHRIQTKCVVPVVNEYWFTIQQSALEEHRAVEVIVSGDGRMDSPGHTAKYCTYTVMNQEDKRILALEVVDKRETMLKSGLMEARGFQKAMSSITNAGVVLKEVVTDAHPQISKIMKTTYQQVRHSYDMWHGAKNLGKKISKIACSKGNGSLTPWLKDITNHFFHSAEFCNGDVLQMKTKWASILNHVANRHSWALGECDHGPIDEDREQKPWLKPASNVMKDLHKQILDKRLLRTFPYYTTCQTTSELESFNNHLLMYAPKRNAFRCQLAAIDYSKHLHREQMMTKDGKPRWTRTYSKAANNWTVHPVKETKTYSYMPELMRKIAQKYCEKDVTLRSLVQIPADDPRRISHHIAPKSPMQTSKIAEELVSRLKKTKKKNP